MSTYENDRYFCAPGTDKRVARIGPRQCTESEVVPCPKSEAEVWSVERFSGIGAGLTDVWVVVGDALDEESAEAFAKFIAQSYAAAPATDAELAMISRTLTVSLGELHITAERIRAVRLIERLVDEKIKAAAVQS